MKRPRRWGKYKIITPTQCLYLALSGNDVMKGLEPLSNVAVGAECEYKAQHPITVMSGSLLINR